MKRLVCSLFVLLAFSFAAPAQNVSDSADIKTVELFSPINAAARSTPAIARRYCFSFITESTACHKVSDIYYGNLRAGNDWDWFQVMGEGSRNRIKSLGKKNWTDDFKIPVVKPYAKLEAGKQRNAVLNSTALGQGGQYPQLPSKEPEQIDRYGNSEKSMSFPSPSSSTDVKTSDYKPFIKAAAGRMYVMRVVDENNDFYVLFRVDELERGKRVKISWKRISAPKAD
jgi:hypothetical protein